MGRAGRRPQPQPLQELSLERRASNQRSKATPWPPPAAPGVCFPHIHLLEPKVEPIVRGTKRCTRAAADRGRAGGARTRPWTTTDDEGSWFLLLRSSATGPNNPSGGPGHKGDKLGASLSIQGCIEPGMDPSEGAGPNSCLDSPIDAAHKNARRSVRERFFLFGRELWITISVDRPRPRPGMMRWPRPGLINKTNMHGVGVTTLPNFPCCIFPRAPSKHP